MPIDDVLPGRGQVRRARDEIDRRPRRAPAGRRDARGSIVSGERIEAGPGRELGGARLEGSCDSTRRPGRAPDTISVLKPPRLRGAAPSARSRLAMMSVRARDPQRPDFAGRGRAPTAAAAARPSQVSSARARAAHAHDLRASVYHGDASEHEQSNISCDHVCARHRCRRHEDGLLPRRRRRPHRRRRRGGGANLQAHGELEVEKVLHAVIEQAHRQPHRSSPPPSASASPASIAKTTTSIVRGIMRRLGFRTQRAGRQRRADRAGGRRRRRSGRRADRRHRIDRVRRQPGRICGARRAAGVRARRRGLRLLDRPTGARPPWCAQADGRGPPTRLTPLVLEHLQLTRVDGLVREVYDRGLQRQSVAALGPVVERARARRRRGGRDSATPRQTNWLAPRRRSSSGWRCAGRRFASCWPAACSD